MISPAREKAPISTHYIGNKNRSLQSCPCKHWPMWWATTPVWHSSFFFFSRNICLFPTVYSINRGLSLKHQKFLSLANSTHTCLVLTARSSPTTVALQENNTRFRLPRQLWLETPLQDSPKMPSLSLWPRPTLTASRWKMAMLPSAKGKIEKSRSQNDFSGVLTFHSEKEKVTTVCCTKKVPSGIQRSNPQHFQLTHSRWRGHSPTGRIAHWLGALSSYSRFTRC